jgi:branched-chain amino acid transport system ATP-binding protein
VLLTIQNLTKQFGGLTAVNRLDLNVERGSLAGLIGPNGAGKTTVFNLITGFMRPTSGKILLGGEDITGRKPHKIAKKGVVRTFQTTSVFPDLTVRQNLMAACHLEPQFGFWESVFQLGRARRAQRMRSERANEILHFVGLDVFSDWPARTLAHGQQRILGIGMALAAEPDVLLLDEPVCGMNAQEVGEARTIIERIWENGVTIILIEHNMGLTMSLCQRVTVLNFGNKIAEGSPDEISRDEDVIQAYLGSSEKYA